MKKKQVEKEQNNEKQLPRQETDCLYSVGSSCAKEEENAYESKASYPGSTASKPAGCLQRFLWKQAIQSDKCISGEEWD